MNIEIQMMGRLAHRIGGRLALNVIKTGGECDRILGRKIDRVQSEVKMPNVDEDLTEMVVVNPAFLRVSDAFIPQGTEFVLQFGKGI
jgi:hypothetical protein